MSVAREILDVEELGEFTTKVNDSCTQLLERAHYTHKIHKDNKVEKAFELTCDELLHDAIAEMNGLAKWLLDALVLKPFNEAFGTALDELCGPLEELIPDPIKEFLSPSDTIKEMASSAVSSALGAILKSGGDQSGPLMSKFHDKGVKEVKMIAGPMKTRGQEEKKEEKKGEPDGAKTASASSPSSDSAPSAASPNAAGNAATASASSPPSDSAPSTAASAT